MDNKDTLMDIKILEYMIFYHELSLKYLRRDRKSLLEDLVSDDLNSLDD